MKDNLVYGNVCAVSGHDYQEAHSGMVVYCRRCCDVQELHQPENRKMRAA